MKTENGGQFCIHRAGLVDAGRQNLIASGKNKLMMKEIPHTIENMYMGASVLGLARALKGV
jgi:hypothetical protein